MAAPPTRFTLADGRPATLLAGGASTVLSIEEALVSSWDLCGRPYALVRSSGSYRRGLDGGLLLKREAAAGRARVRRRLNAVEGATVVEAARLEAEMALQALGPAADAEAQGRLRAIVAMDREALAADAARFLEVSGPVRILPPDQYLSLVVRVTEGCSWNACNFCGLYRDVPFRHRTAPELQSHLDALHAYFGRSLALRRSVFLGDANALCLGQERLLPLLETVARSLPGRPIYSFVDAWTGKRRSADDWRACAALGLRRVYVGLETGDPGLLAWLGKPGTPADTVRLVRSLHAADIDVGVIVLVGAGGERFYEDHVRGTWERLREMGLGKDDLLYFSEYADDPRLAYGRRAAGAFDLQPLSPERAAAQRAAIETAVRAPDAAVVRTAAYDLREFVY